MTTNTKTTSKPKPLGTPAAFAQAAECLKTLAHPVRLWFVQLRLRGRYTVGEMADDCGVPNNVASEHLRLMQRCGLFTSERQGRRVYYQIVKPHLQKIRDGVESRFLKT